MSIGYKIKVQDDEERVNLDLIFSDLKYENKNDLDKEVHSYYIKDNIVSFVPWSVTKSIAENYFHNVSADEYPIELTFSEFCDKFYSSQKVEDVEDLYELEYSLTDCLEDYEDKRTGRRNNLIQLDCLSLIDVDQLVSLFVQDKGVRYITVNLLFRTGQTETVEMLHTEYQELVEIYKELN